MPMKTIGAWMDVGELVGLQLVERREAECDEREHCHDSDNRSLDGEIGDEHLGLADASLAPQQQRSRVDRHPCPPPRDVRRAGNGEM